VYSRIRMQKQYTTPKHSITNIPQHALHINLQLSKSSEIPSYLKAASVKEVLKYILYSRGVHPIQSDDLLKQMEQWKNDSFKGGMEHTRRKVSDIRQRRKCQKYGQQLQNVLKDIDDLFKYCDDVNHETNNVDIKAILITLGPTFSSPREQFILRFLEWDPISYSSNIGRNAVPYHVKERLQTEIGRRTVREIVLGSLQEDYMSMFQQHKGSERSTTSSCRKVNIAAFVTESALDALFHQQCSISDFSKTLSFNETTNDSTKSMGSDTNASNSGAHDKANDMLGDSFAPRYTVQRHFELRIPRMYSKRKGHRPFVVLDVMPMLRPSLDITDDAPQMIDKDCIWITLKSCIKGFKI